ncbi:MAG TPA: hypothetical protein PLZ84_02640, partial [Clostridia bacterium]|nr:hypothetical protein [Clostridia bacterium]
MSVKGIDNIVIIQKSAEANKKIDLTQKHDAFQKALSSENKMQAERNTTSVPETQRGYKLNIDKDAPRNRNKKEKQGSTAGQSRKD